MLLDSSVTVAPRVVFTKTGKISTSKRGAKVHKCEFDSCGKTFSRAEHLRRHQLVHDDSFQLICPFPGCGRPFYRDDLFKKHQRRHNEPNNKVSSVTVIPGCSIIPIRIVKPTESPSSSSDVSSSGSSDVSLKSRRSTPESDISCEDADVAGANALEVFHQKLSEYSTVLELETFGAADDDRKEDVIVFQELGRLRPMTAMRIIDVQRSVGWNVDPFTRMPKFKDRRVNTTEIYHHCLKNLGRVGKSPDWLLRIVEDRLGFLSSLAIASAHLDMLRGIPSESPVTLAIKYEVLQMLRDSTALGHQTASDLTFMAVTQFLSCEMIYGEREVVLTHVRGLEGIAMMRGGLKKLGWSHELGTVAGGKVMIISIAYDWDCSPIWLETDYLIQPHFPSLCRNTPESPLFYLNQDLGHLRTAQYCNEATYEILTDMRWLTDSFISIFIDRSPTVSGDLELRMTQFDVTVAAIYARLANRPSLASSPYYEVVRLASLIWTTALQYRISFAEAASRAGTNLPELISGHYNETEIISLWRGDMAGVLLWCSLISAAAAGPLRTPSGLQAARWARIVSMYCMILLSTEHYQVFYETTKSFIEIQSMLRQHNITKRLAKRTTTARK